MRPKSIKIGLLQFSVDSKQPENNFNSVLFHLNASKDSLPDLVVLPELWYTGFNFEHISKWASERMDEGAFSLMSRLAIQFQIAICGTHIRAENQRFFNTLALFSADGTLQASYDKIHLFAPMGEDRFLSAGQDLPEPKQFHKISFGFGICYDLRFPELFRIQTAQGAEIFLLPAQWPRARIQHWQILLQARAIENQAYFIAVNRVGGTGHQQFPGNSMVVAPSGEIIFQASDQEGLFVVEIALDQIQMIRQKWPFLRDMKTNLFFRDGVYHV